MKKEELELLREKYKSLIRQKEEIIELERKIKLLEKLPEVKEYIEAINLYNEKTYKKNNMEKKDNSYFINRVINTHKITPTNDIYVYIGTYKYSDEIDIVHCSNDILVDRNNNKAASVVNTTAAYRGCQNQSEWDGTYRSALGLPANAVGIPSIRTYTANIGPTWHCYDITTHQLIYWLYAVEYANLNWQADYSSTLTAEGYHKGGLGSGVSNIASDKWNTYNGYHAFIPCGFTNSLGNNSGIKTFTFSTEQANAYGTSYSVPVNSYRGIEIPFGYLWLPIEGYLGIGDGTYQSGYICRDITKFASSLTNDYEFIGKQPKLDWSYGKDIIRNSKGDLFPILNGGGASSNAYFCDIFYNAVSNGTVYELLVGGHADYGYLAGPAFLYSGDGFGWAGTNHCFRIISQKTNNV